MYLRAPNAIELLSRILTKSDSTDGVLFVDKLDTSATCLAHGSE
jgi:hypothetical protein